MGLFGFREQHTPQGVGHYRGKVLGTWNVVWLGFAWIRVLMSGRIIPVIGEPPTPLSFNSAISPVSVSFSLQVGDQGLVEFGLSSWTHLILIGLCYALVLCHSFKFCPGPYPPVSCSFPEPHLDLQCCLYNLLGGQPENGWPMGGKCCKISNPSRNLGLHLPCFLQHLKQQHLSVTLLRWLTGPQCLLEVHLLASLQGQLSFQG